MDTTSTTLRASALAIGLMLGGLASAEPEQLAATCGTESSYDLSIGPDWLHFQRDHAVASQVSVGGGRLRVDGAPVELSLSDRDRLVLFEQVLRDLVPDVKTVARQGVDLALDAVRAEIRDVTGSPPGPQAESRMVQRRDALHARIDASRSTLEWQGEAFEREMQAMANEIIPLLAADVARRGMELAMAGDMAGASALQRRAQALPTTMRARIEASLQPLQPQVARLCPRVRELAELNAGLGMAPVDGHRVELLRMRR